MIAVAHPLAADAGYRILEKGGSAVDASIAAEDGSEPCRAPVFRHRRRRFYGPS